MKSETVLKSLVELSPQMVEEGKGKLAEANSKLSSAGAHQPQQTQSLVQAPDDTDFSGYRHWGLNE